MMKVLKNLLEIATRKKVEKRIKENISDFSDSKFFDSLKPFNNRLEMHEERTTKCF